MIFRLLTISLCILNFGCSQVSEVSDQTESRQNGSPDRSLIEYQDVITEDLLHNHLAVIAHDSLQGRETGTEGQVKAARYLASQYERYGLQPVANDGSSYLQTFTLLANRTDSLRFNLFTTAGQDTTLFDSYSVSTESPGPFIRLFGGAFPLTGELVFAGFGVNDTPNNVLHLDDMDVEAKWVLMFEEIPYVIEGDTLINPSITQNSRYGNILGQKGADGILLIGTEDIYEFGELSEITSEILDKPTGLSLPYLDRSQAGRFPKGIFKISPDLAAFLLGFQNEVALVSMKDRITANITEFEPLALDYILDYRPYDNEVEIETENVVAKLEGGHKTLKEEVIVLTSHYDHLGITLPNESGDSINNGADDDGSGTAALLSIARAFQEAAENGVRPDRSILFLNVTAEEKGLLGSRYYSDHPLVPIEKTVANLNADMIGRSTPERRESGNTDYVFLIGGEIISSSIDSLVKVANRKSSNLNLDPTFNDLKDPNQFYRRSDHWNFGRFGVPFVFFFTGVHEDYHQPSDEIGKINFSKLQKVTRLIYSSAVEIANHPERPETDNEAFIKITQQ